MNRIVAGKMTGQPDERGLPDISGWENALMVAFCADWRGDNADPARETTVRMLWSPDHLFLRFHCRFREIYVYEECNSRRDMLWQRDVAEVFIQPEGSDPKRYKEFEISPNGNWLDLDIAPGEKSILLCDLKTRVTADNESRIWIAELGIPTSCLTSEFDPAKTWRLNFFRIEGPEPNRFYSAWRPTFTPKPNFHVPEAFGSLSFAE